jgi:hypothetical protein
MKVMNEYRIIQLINLLKTIPDKNIKAIWVQKYISAYGVIPVKYDDEIRSLLR